MRWLRQRSTTSEGFTKGGAASVVGCRSFSAHGNAYVTSNIYVSFRSFENENSTLDRRTDILRCHMKPLLCPFRFTHRPTSASPPSFVALRWWWRRRKVPRISHRRMSRRNPAVPPPVPKRRSFRGISGREDPVGRCVVWPT